MGGRGAAGKEAKGSRFVECSREGAMSREERGALANKR